MIEIQKIETQNAPQAIGPYSQAIFVHPFLYVSGQLPLDAQTGKLVETDILKQTLQVLGNVEAILLAAGSNWQQVIKTEIFLKDLSHFSVVNEEYGKRINPAKPPARQTIQAAKLPLDALIEISCVAFVSLT